MGVEFFVFILGLITGSFLNVVIYRLPRGESLFYPGSYCAACRHKLAARDLVPVLSYIRLKGRCRYCRESISFHYPLVEIITAAGLELIYLQWGSSITTAAGWILTALLIAAACIDIDEGIIPDRLTYPGIILGLVLSYPTVGVTSSILGAVLFGGLLLVMALISRGGMGGGDIKLAVLIGAFTGLEGAVCALVLSSLLGGGWAVMLILKKKAHRKTAIKFGPFLALGGWLAFTYGPQVISFYFNH